MIKKVLSIVLTALMLMTVATVAVSAAESTETAYKAGTEIKLIYKLKNVDKFNVFQYEFKYPNTLDYVTGSYSSPNTRGEEISNTTRSGKFKANISNVLTPYDMSADHILFTANFVVNTDLTSIDTEMIWEDIYYLSDKESGLNTIDLDRTSEIVIEVVSESTKETEPSSLETEPSTDVEIKNGIYDEDGGKFYYKDGKRYYAGLIMIDGYYYYVNSSCRVITNKRYTISKTNHLLSRDVYTFDAEGRMIDVPNQDTSKITCKAGTEIKLIYKLVNVNTFDACEYVFCYPDTLDYVDGSYDSVHTRGEEVANTSMTGEISVNTSNILTPYDMSADHILFTANFIVNTDLTSIDTEMIWEDIYHCIYEEGVPIPNYIDLDRTFDIVIEVVSDSTESPKDENSSVALKNGIYEENGVKYYYKDGKKYYAGLIMIDGYYYYVNSSCRVVTDKVYGVSKTNLLLPRDLYEFDAEGRIIDAPEQKKPAEGSEDTGVKNGIVEENGTLYYYVDGVKTYAGVIEIDGDLYYVNSSCRVITGQKYYVSLTNDLVPRGAYTFDATGKMIK